MLFSVERLLVAQKLLKEKILIWGKGHHYPVHSLCLLIDLGASGPELYFKHYTSDRCGSHRSGLKPYSVSRAVLLIYFEGTPFTSLPDSSKTSLNILKTINNIH